MIGSKRLKNCTALAQKIQAALNVCDDRAGQGKVVALLSRRSGEGTTLICYELARTILAQATQRTLCIDASYDRSRLVRRYGAPGTLLSGEALNLATTPEALLAEAMQTTTDGVALLALADASVMRASGWPALLEHINAHFDIILVDAGFLEVGTPYAWNTDARLKLLVVDASRTTTPMLERLRSDLKAADFEISGVVLNRMRQVIPGFIYRHLV